MVPDALSCRVPEMMDTPPIQNNYAFIFPLQSNVSFSPSKITKSHGLFFDRDFLFISLLNSVVLLLCSILLQSIDSPLDSSRMILLNQLNICI